MKKIFLASCLLSMVLSSAGCVLFEGIDPLRPPSGSGPAGEEGEVTIDPEVISIVAPESGIRVRETIRVQLAVSLDEPERVELLRNGEFLSKVTAPYEFIWYVATIPDGKQMLKARVHASSGAIFESEEIEIHVDRTGPEIVERFPDEATDNADIRQPIRIEFDEPLDPLTVHSDSFDLVRKAPSISFFFIKYEDTPIPVDVELEEGGTTVLLTPKDAVTGPASLELSVRNTITDTAGNPTRPSQWAFGISAFADVSPPIQGYRSPRIAIDENDMIWVATVQEDSGSNVRVMTADLSGFEDVGALLDADSATGAISREVDDIVLLGSDDVYVAWRAGDGGPQWDLYISHWNGTAWEGAAEPVASGIYSRARLAALDSGDVIAVWQESAPPDGRLILASSSMDWATVGSLPESEGQTSWTWSAEAFSVAGGDHVSIAVVEDGTDARAFDFDKGAWVTQGFGELMNDTLADANFVALGKRGDYAVVAEEFVGVSEGDLDGNHMRLKAQNSATGRWGVIVDDDGNLSGKINRSTEWEVTDAELFVNSNLKVWVAWEELETNRPSPVAHVRVSKWSGTSWSSYLGEHGFSDSASEWTTNPSLVANEIEQPIVAYQRDDNVHVEVRNKFKPDE